VAADAQSMEMLSAGDKVEAEPPHPVTARAVSPAAMATRITRSL
jgi:hypothetical protein